MRTVITTLVLIVMFFSTPGLADKVAAIKDYPADKVADNVYVIHGPLGMPNPENQGFMNNPAFVITRDGIVVIDPGSSVQIGEMLLRVIASVSDKPVIAIFNTHIHGDHWLANQALRAAYPDALIYGHANMIALIEAGAGQTWVDLLERLTKGQTGGTGVTGPDTSVENGDVFKYGGMTFKVHYYGKAHTTSDIMIEIPELSVVFLGDNALNRRIPRMDDGDFQGNIKACTKIMETHSKVYVPGHGPTGDVSVPVATRNYLQVLYSTVQKYFDEGLSDYEMKKPVAEALAAYADWSGFEEQLGRHISLVYLQVEEAAFE